MIRIKLPLQQIKLTIAIAIVVLVIFTTCFTQIQAQTTKPAVSTVRFVPPLPPLKANRAAPPGRQRGGASRGTCPITTKELTALVPGTQKTLGEGQEIWESGLEFTAAESPTFWFYVPYSLTSKLPIEFVLQDEQDNDVYKTYFIPSEKSPGIFKFRLPSTAAPLEIGKIYHWYLNIYCAPDNPKFVDGWVQRVALNPTLISQLEKAAPTKRVAIYANNGIWYDALTTLAELRSANPEDTTLSNDWVSLLQPIGLDAIAQEPIVECCTTEN